MKRYFIILIALVISFALPVFAGTPTAENAPAASEEDAWLWLNSLSEEELMEIFGQIEVAAFDYNITGSNTADASQIIKKNELKNFLAKSVTLYSVIQYLVYVAKVSEVTAAGAIIIGTTATAVTVAVGGVIIVISIFLLID